MDTLSILLGWLLGMLSPVIVNRIYRHYQKNDLHAGVSKEINHVKERLILTLDLIAHRTGTYNRELIRWLLEHYEKAEHQDETILELYRMQLKVSDAELEAMIFHQAKPDDTGLTLQNVQLLFINMHLTDISLFSSELQSEIFELKTRIEILNSNISLAEKYFFMTFDSSLESDNHALIKADLTNKYVQIETMIKSAVEQIEKINCVKKI